ncbi:hypothetical protein [Mycolicibacterium farcinogenes]|uniref:Uncharacterized protein n=1 Tax=Mycolicibacterium farcinogenes TaxID=1802 RepID=A0ACD1F9T7_MYCFR|nr:hypothetical protein [Mycolicibacterium farcinogenes]QZH63807.1 hypothetical protein K6L26_17145 [Mycolicibacterium farcinogenes]
MKFRFEADELDELEKGIFASGWASEVRDIAIESGVNPVGVYVMCLQRRLAQIPPDVLLPPPGGSGCGGSLNTIVLGVGDSGGGKNSAWNLAQALSPYQEGKLDVRQIGVGTGEHLIHACIKYTKDGAKTVRDAADPYYKSVYSIATEGRLLDKELSREGSKAAELLCEMWTGAFVGAAARGDADRWIAQHAVRWNCLLMIQPANLGGFAAQEATGLPQRLTWFAVNEPRAPMQVPERRKFLPTMPRIPGDGPFSDEIPVDAAIRQEIWDQHNAIRRGDLPGIDAHRSFAMLKMAAAISFSEAKFGVSWNHWERAGAIMRMSDAVRDRAMECQRAHAAEAAKEAEVSRAVARGHAKVAGGIAEEQAAEDYAERVEEMQARILAALQEGPVPHRDLTRKCGAHRASTLPRQAFRAALTNLKDRGAIRRDPPGVDVGGVWHLANVEATA